MGEPLNLTPFVSCTGTLITASTIAETLLLRPFVQAILQAFTNMINSSARSNITVVVAFVASLRGPSHLHRHTNMTLGPMNMTHQKNIERPRGATEYCGAHERVPGYG